MNTTTSATEPPAPFRRPMEVARLSREAETQFRISAEPGELVELARYLDVVRIDRLTLAGFISPTESEGWRVRGRLVAQIEQSCVVSLTPLSARHNAEIERLYLPADKLAPEPDVLFAHDDQDAPDPFIDIIDPARFAVESLALMIDPFPRARDAELARGQFSAPGITPMSDEASLPFAGLAVLKRRSGDSEN
jgi:hypothetical protein